MSVGSDPDLVQVRDPESCREWLRGLPDDDAERVSAIGSLLAQLSHPRIGGDVLFEILEPLRLAQLPSIERLLKPLGGRPVPYSQAEWQRLGSALANLRGSRNLYKRTYAQMLRGDTNDARSIIPGTSESLRVVMPLVRALDAQARVVALLLRHRSVPPAADWDELCVLARHVRRTSFQDEPLPDDLPLVRPATARALFVYPLLLECAALSGRSLAEASFTERLAARLAARVGYRIDHGAPRENAHGPRVALSLGYAVRLDTHRVPATIGRRRQQWLAPRGDGAPIPQLPLTPSALAALLDDLERRWTATGVPIGAGAHPAAAQPARSVRLRFGLPRMHSADVRLKLGEGAAPVTGAAASRSQAHGPAAGATRYDYGRWEQNTIMRLAMGSRADRADPIALLMAEGEIATRLADRPDGRAVIARQGAIPRALIGSLVAIGGAEGRDAGEAQRRGAGAADGGAELRLGTVEAIEQLAERDGLSVQSHWLVVRPWAGVVAPVGVRVGDVTFFEDAWLLRGSGSSSELPCIVMAPGRAQGGAHGLLRERGCDMAVRFVSVLDRGPGYERLSMRVEPARGKP